MNALELFGGIEAIRERITQLITQRLRDMPKSDILELEEALSLSRGALRDFPWGLAPDLSKDLFEKLSCALSISIEEVLGAPRFNGNEALWLDEFKRSDLMVLGNLGTEKQGSGAANSSTEFDLFVTLRAVEELSNQLNQEEHVSQQS